MSWLLNYLVETPRGYIVDHEFLRCEVHSPDDLPLIARQIEAKQKADANAIRSGNAMARVLLRSPYHRVAMLRDAVAVGAFSMSKAFAIARSTWIELDEVHSQKAEWQELFAMLHSSREMLMNNRELARLSQLPNDIRIFRGHSRKHSRKGICWSMSKIIASQYAIRAGERKISQGVISKDDVMALIMVRGHLEIIPVHEDRVVLHRAVSATSEKGVMRWAMAGQREETEDTEE